MQYLFVAGKLFQGENQFVWGFSTHSWVFHSYGDVIITGENLQIHVYSALMTIEQWGFFSVPHLLWHGASVYNLRTHNTRTYCRAFGSRAVPTCFYDLDLSQFWIEYSTFRLRNERSNPDFEKKKRCNFLQLSRFVKNKYFRHIQESLMTITDPTPVHSSYMY